MRMRTSAGSPMRLARSVGGVHLVDRSMAVVGIYVLLVRAVEAFCRRGVMVRSGFDLEKCALCALNNCFPFLSIPM